MEVVENPDINVQEPKKDIQLHKVFVDLSLENDLKEEEKEWFKSRMCLRNVEDIKSEEQKLETACRRVEIITAYNCDKLSEKANKLFLKLSETTTIWFLSLDTTFSQNDIEDSERVRQENETYEMKKRKKELIRKRCMADTQTPSFMEKSVGTLTDEINMVDGQVNASEWDLYDTYKALEERQVSSSKKFPTLEDATGRKAPNLLSSKTENILKDDDIFQRDGFKYAALVTERLLASNSFQTEQSVFKKKFKHRYDDEPTLFSYNMELLWNFHKELKHPLMVTDMDWNPLNYDILAVGYGDLRFDKISLGLVCIWSPKNPRQPEREFSFDDSVTSLHYSRTRPNILAVGTRTGNVYTLDISTQKGNARLLERLINPIYAHLHYIWSKFNDCARNGSSLHIGPIWKVEWFRDRELLRETEKLLAVGENGILMCFSSDKEIKDILKLDYITSTRNIPSSSKRSSKKLSLRQPVENVIFDKKTFSGLWFSIFPDRNFCYISTKEGAIVKCNLRNPSMTDGVFLAHDGPVYAIQVSPCTSMIYFTCGADWNIRIWMKGVSEPLITLQSKTPVMCARWSPNIPTLIASVGESELCLWDIGRNVISPKSIKNFNECEKPFTNLMFSKNGRNIAIGGQDGLVRIVHLSELPRVPFLQKEALVGAITRAIRKKQGGLSAEFKRVLQINKDKLTTEITV